MDRLALDVIRSLEHESDVGAGAGADTDTTGRDSIFVLMGDHGMTDEGNVLAVTYSGLQMTHCLVFSSPHTQYSNTPPCTC